MSKVKILVVEDEAIIAYNLCDTLNSFGYDAGEPAMTYDEAIEMIDHEKPHLAILDIQLATKKTGIDLGMVIHKKHDFPFIYLTSNSDKSTFDDAKLSEPYAFLLKPFVKEELRNAVELALYNFSKKKESVINEENLIVNDALFIKQKQSFVRLNFGDICYIQSDSVYLDVYLTNGKSYTVRGSLNEYITKLDKSFVRCHRSYIINAVYLESINHITASVHGKDIPVGRKHREDLLAKLNRG